MDDRTTAVTKFALPPLPRHHLPRTRLYGRIGPATGAELTLVVGPPGYGKTVLVREWCERAWEGCVAWLTLDRADNEPARFWTRVAEALVRANADLVPHAELLVAPDDRVDANALADLVNACATTSSPTVLVLEDYHVVTDRVIHETLRWFIEQRTGGVHVVLTSRHDPPLALSRMRARGLVAEVRQADLRCVPAEAVALLDAYGAHGLREADVVALAERTEGWVAGLQLAALALQRSSDPARLVQQFCGTTRIVADFLLEEVLADLPPAWRDFLLTCSVLEELTPEVCDAVTGRDDSIDLLRAIESEQLFVVCIDDLSQTYRVHQLLRDLLRHELASYAPEDFRVAHQRASLWYDAHGRPIRAILHSTAIDDYERVMELALANLPLLASLGRDEVQRFVDDIPEAFVAERAERMLDYALVVAVVGRFGLATTVRDRAIATFDETTPVSVRGYGRWLEAVGHLPYGEYDLACAVREDARRMVPDPASLVAERTWPLFVRAANMNGRHDAAIAEYRAGVEAFGADPVLLSFGESAVAEAYFDAGRLREAAAYAARALRDVSSMNVYATVALLDAIRVQAGLELEHGAPEAALGLLEPTCETLALLDPDVQQPVRVSALRARILLALDRPLDALAVIDERLGLAIEPGLAPVLRSHLAEPEVRAALALGNLPRAHRAAGLLVVEPQSTRLRAEVALADGDAPYARRLLASLPDPVDPRARIEHHLLAARVATSDGDRLRHACEALLAGADEGFLGIFVDAPDLRPQFEHIAQRGASPMLDGILAAVHGRARRASEWLDGGQRLTERERQVLVLLPTHLSYQEIAGELGVSLNTLKTHVRSVYRKLGADCRTDAVSRARGAALV